MLQCYKSTGRGGLVHCTQCRREPKSVRRRTSTAPSRAAAGGGRASPKPPPVAELPHADVTETRPRGPAGRQPPLRGRVACSPLPAADRHAGVCSGPASTAPGAGTPSSAADCRLPRSRDAHLARASVTLNSRSNFPTGRQLLRLVRLDGEGVTSRGRGRWQRGRWQYVCGTPTARPAPGLPAGIESLLAKALLSRRGTGVRAAQPWSRSLLVLPGCVVTFDAGLSPPELPVAGAGNSNEDPVVNVGFGFGLPCLPPFRVRRLFQVRAGGRWRPAPPGLTLRQGVDAPGRKDSSVARNL